MTSYCLRTNWRWVVTVASFVHYAVFYGFLYNYSILFLSFQREFNSGIAATGWVGSVANALACLLTPVSSLVLRRVSCRTGSVLGVVVFSAGLVITSFATELWHTFLVFGILTGVGCNLLVVADFKHLGRWFKGTKSFAKASAVASAGSPAGMMCMSSILTALIGAYGWRHCLRIVSAGTFLVGLLAAWTLREPSPMEKRTESDVDAETEAPPAEETLLGRPTVKPECSPQERPCQAETRLTSEAGPDSDGTPVETRLVSERSPAEKLELEGSAGRPLWSTVLRLPTAWLFSAAAILATNAYTFQVINFGSFMDDLQFTANDIKLCITLFGLAGVMGKVIVAAISGVVTFPLHFISLAGCLVGALMSAMMTFTRGLVLLAIYCFMFGLARASLYSLCYGSSKQLFGDYGMSIVNAFAMVPSGIGILIAAPITGGLYDVTGNYTLSLLVIIGCFVTSSVCFLLIPPWKKLKFACLPCVTSDVKDQDAN